MCPGWTGEKWSGRKDLNLRPPGPEPGALARLRYAPNLIHHFTLVYAPSRASATAGRVENRRIGCSLPVACDSALASPPQSGLTWLWFLFPLIAPDVQISRIRR
jgi:hypothetical protein